MTPAANTSRLIDYDSIREAGYTERMRWIGRCKRDQRTHRIDGKVMRGYRTKETGGGSDFVITADNGLVFMCADLGSNPYDVHVRCGDHWCRLHRVHEGKKNSKHECGARCTNATGPACDCKCKGKNHGSGAGVVS